MNKAITDGMALSPPAFASGLEFWSRGDGTKDAPSYAGAADVALVPADEDFGACLELYKTEDRQLLRYMGKTPLLSGSCLQITTRVKAVCGPLPTVRISGVAGKLIGAVACQVPTKGPAEVLGRHDAVRVVSAIVGIGESSPVDVSCGTDVPYGHFGLEIEGPNGCVLRIDNFEIKDVTRLFLPEVRLFEGQRA